VPATNGAVASKRAGRRTSTLSSLDDAFGALAPDGDAAPSDLLASPPVDTLPEHGTLLRIALDDIEPDPRQPRKVFGDARLRELTNDIRRIGLLSSLVVAPTGRQHPLKTWQLVAGERRFRALSYLYHGEGDERFRLVPCIVSRAGTADQLASSLTENLFRENLTPLEESECLLLMQRECGLRPTEIAAKLSGVQSDGSTATSGRTTSWVSQRLTIAEQLIPESRDQLIDWMRATKGDPRVQASETPRIGPSFSLLRSLAQVPADHQVETIRAIMDRRLSAQAADAYVAEFLAEAEGDGTTQPRRGRPRLQVFDVRPSDRIAVQAEQRPITVRTPDGVSRIDRIVVDVRETNVVRLVGQVKRRNWQVEPREWLGALEAALLQDRAAIQQHLPIDQELVGENLRP
jgi:ParB/RepB/Spo0J family partition protein